MALCQERHPITDQLCAVPESKHNNGDHLTTDKRRWRTDHSNPAWEAMQDKSAARRLSGGPELHADAYTAIQHVLELHDNTLDPEICQALLLTSNYHWLMCERLGVPMPDPDAED